VAIDTYEGIEYLRPRGTWQEELVLDVNVREVDYVPMKG
jgi:hypothetical protein